MRGRWARPVLGVAVVVLVGGGFYWALKERPVEIEAVAATRGPMSVTIDQEGVTRIRNVYSVSSPIAGHLDRPTLQEGDRVRKGQTVIATVRPLAPPFLDERTRAELQATIEAARSAVAVAEVERQRVQTALDLARADFSRAERLAATNTVSVRTLQKAANDVALLEAQLRSAEASIQVRKAELASGVAKLAQPGQTAGNPQGRSCCIRLLSPVDGKVLKMRLKSAQALGAGTVVADVGDPADLEIVVDLLSSDAVRVHPGSKALVTEWGGDHDLPATVRRVEPAGFTKVSALGIEEQRVNAILDLDRPEPRLGDAFRVFARIVAWHADDVLRVPLGALFRTGDDWTVFRVEDGRARRVRVEVGHMNGDLAEVTGGVKAGDILVLYPGDSVSDGKLVERRKTAGDSSGS